MRAKLLLGAISAINRTVLSSPPQVLFHRPFIGEASFVAPQCYQQNLFNGDPSLISTYFMLRSAQVLHAFV